MGESKEIPESIFADDDGSADARLAQALIRFSRGKAPLLDVVDALAFARVLVPILASGEARHVGVHGLEQDAIASTGVVAVQAPDGRTALPVFTDVDAMQQWNADARPVPAEGPRAALAAIAEEWAVMVVNPGMESVIIPRPAVWALGQGKPWKPAIVNGTIDPDVRAAVVAAIDTDSLLLEVDAVAGSGAEVTVILRLVPGLTEPELNDVTRRVQRQLASSDVVAERIDSLRLRLAQV